MFTTLVRRVSKKSISSSIINNGRNKLFSASNNTRLLTSTTAINHEVTSTTFDNLMNSSVVEWSRQYSFTAPESDFTIMDYIDNNDIARSSLAYSLSFTDNNDDNCVSSLLTDDMKLQLANVGLLGQQK